jgi:short-chain Z-isoprenyl diphosphate synthase
VLSTDNFSRSSAEEIGPLLRVIENMVNDLAASRRWRVHPVGALDLLPAESAEALKHADRDTADIAGMLVNIAVSYGGRHEPRRRTVPARQHAHNGTPSGAVPDPDTEHIAEHLYTAPADPTSHPHLGECASGF